MVDDIPQWLKDEWRKAGLDTPEKPRDYSALRLAVAMLLAVTAMVLIVFLASLVLPSPTSLLGFIGYGAVVIVAGRILLTLFS